MNLPAPSKYRLSDKQSISSRHLSVGCYIKGSVLIISLWILFFLTFFTVVLGTIIMQRLNAADRIDGGIKSYFAASSAVEMAKAVLNQEEPENPENPEVLYYNWACDERVFKGVKIGEAVYNVSYELNEGDAEPRTIYGLIDEERKININKATKEILETFLTQMNIEEAKTLASSIVDRRSEDLNGDFKSIYELLLVKDMKKDYFDAIKEYITVFGDGRININTASKDVLMAIDFSAALIDTISNYRSGPDEKRFTSDDRTFSGAESVIRTLDSFKKLTDGEKNEIQNAVASGLIGTEAQFFRIKATGETAAKRSASHIDCVITKDSGILFWNET